MKKNQNQEQKKFATNFGDLLDVQKPSSFHVKKSLYKKV